MDATPTTDTASCRVRLQDVSRGYQSSVVLLTACKMGVFDALGDASRTARDLAGALRLDARALEIVLLALASDGFLKADGKGGFRVADKYAPYLLSDGARTQASILRHQYNCLQRWRQLAEVLRTGKPAPRDEEGPDDMRAFIRGMSDISRMSSAEVADKVDLSPFRRMLDVGGGPATASIEFARRHPALRCVVFDLEGPLGIAREEIAKAGLADRIETRAGDYYHDAFGEGFDLVYISNIIHSMAPDDVPMLFEKSRRALASGGTIIVKDFFLEDDRISPNVAALFSVNMLVGTEAGRSYTLRETQEMLSRVGFTDFQEVEVAAASKLLIARAA
jgi:ubiquinone/menaquinone biosynthesis C-methylase UbiE